MLQEGINDKCLQPVGDPEGKLNCGGGYGNDEVTVCNSWANLKS